MIPLNYLRPCMEAIQGLVRHYACTAVLCTATQPPLEQFFAADMQPIEICPAVMENAAFFQRTKIELREHPMPRETLAAELEKHAQVLCIVNGKRTAQKLFDRIESKDGVYHLSTNLYPVHRERVLAEIRSRLKAGQTCRVISTSLVEAGVDLDFPCVYRELNGIDSIVQAAGRCNRENRKGLEESPVYVFSFEDTKKKNFLAADTTQIVARKYGENLANPAAIRMYFNELYDLGGEKRLDCKDIMGKSRELAFAKIAEEFRLIEEQTISVLIPLEDEAKELLRHLEAGERSRSLLRKAARYMASARSNIAEELLMHGALYKMDEEITVLVDLSAYDMKKGLMENEAEEEQKK